MTPEPGPHAIRPTGPGVLAVLAVVGCGLTWLLVSRFYGVLPPLPLVAFVTPAVLVVVLVWLARTTRDRIARRPAAARLRPLDPLVVARFLVLAKACSHAGALLAGAWAGFLLALVGDIGRVTAANRDAVAAGIGVVLSVAVVLAALWLEHACRVPPSPDGEGQPGGSERRKAS